jgi:hypothetical protein
MHKIRATLLFALLTLALASLFGCGGGGETVASSRTGTVVLRHDGHVQIPQGVTQFRVTGLAADKTVIFGPITLSRQQSHTSRMSRRT